MVSTPYNTQDTQLNYDGPAAVTGLSATDVIGFYGLTPIAQRSLAAQATSTLSTASSTAIDTQTKASIIEIMSTLTALGLWKGSA